MPASPSTEPAENTVAATLNAYLQSLDKIRFCGQAYITAAALRDLEFLKTSKAELEELGAELGKMQEGGSTLGYHATARRVRDITGHLSIQSTRIIAHSLFVMLFSRFDAFIGDLLKALYRSKPAAMAGIDRTVTYKDLSAAESIEELKEMLLDREIEALRRESYVDQFKALEARFGFRTLREFANWPSFVEASQRRNVIVHCDGAVTHQYIQNCKSVGYVFDVEPRGGEQLAISAEYFYRAVDVAYEVGFKLAITLWRKVLSDDSLVVDELQSDVVYGLIENGRLRLARELGEFGIASGKPRSDKHARIVRVNLAQALKWSGDASGCERVLSEVDWSSTAEPFQLAVAVLQDRFEAAGDLMRAIGARNHPSQDAYHSWPLFRELRRSEYFATAYRDVFGEPFEAVAARLAEVEVRRALEEERLRTELNDKRDQLDAALDAATSSAEVGEA